MGFLGRWYRKNISGVDEEAQGTSDVDVFEEEDEPNTVLVYDNGVMYDEYDPLMMDSDPIVGVQFWTHRSGKNPEQIVMSMFTERRWKTASFDAAQAKSVGEAMVRWAETQEG